MVKERTGGEFYHHLFGAVFQLCDFERIERTHGAIGLTFAVAECREIMVADEVRCCLAHRVEIHRLRHMPYMRGIDRWPRGAVENTVKIMPRFGIEPGVEIVAHRLGLQNNNGVGEQIRIHALADIHRLAVHRQIHMRHLATRMNSGIGAAGANYLDRRLHELGERLLQRALHGFDPLLLLPAMEGCAVIFDGKFVARHFLNRT